MPAKWCWRSRAASTIRPAPPGAKRPWSKINPDPDPVPGRFTSPPSARPRVSASTANNCKILAPQLESVSLRCSSHFWTPSKPPPGLPVCQKCYKHNGFGMISRSTLGGFWPILGPKRAPKRAHFHCFGPQGSSWAPPEALLEARGPR